MGIFLDFMLVLGAVGWVFYLAKLIYDAGYQSARIRMEAEAERAARAKAAAEAAVADQDEQDDDDDVEFVCVNIGDHVRVYFDDVYFARGRIIDFSGAMTPEGLRNGALVSIPGRRNPWFAKFEDLDPDDEAAINYRTPAGGDRSAN